MRFIGLILALAAIGWVLMRSAGDGDAGGALPGAYRESLDKAEAVQDSVETATQKRLDALDEGEQ